MLMVAIIGPGTTSVITRTEVATLPAITLPGETVVIPPTTLPGETVTVTGTGMLTYPQIHPSYCHYTN
jgi:hypothetical protein